MRFLIGNQGKYKILEFLCCHKLSKLMLKYYIYVVEIELYT